MGGGQGPVTAQTVLSTLGSENPQKINKFSQVLFRYLLLDILANVLEVPRHPFQQLVASQLPPMPQSKRMRQVRVFPFAFQMF
jgi:hypothetical protein